MANGKTTSTARRREVRRNVPRPGRIEAWVGWLRRREVGWAIVFVLLFTAVAGVLLIGVRENPRYQVDQFITKPIVSRVQFNAIDRKKTEELKNVKMRNEPPVFEINRAFADELTGGFDRLWSLAENETFDDVPEETRQNIKLTSSGLSQLKRYHETQEGKAEWDRLVTEFLYKLFNLAIVDPDQYKRGGDRFGSGSIVIHYPDPQTQTINEKVRWPDSVYVMTEHEKVRKAVDLEATIFPSSLRDTVTEMVMIDLKPTYTHAQQLSRDRAVRAAEAVEKDPPVIAFEANSVLIPAGKKLTAIDLDLLEQERAEFARTQSATHKWLIRLGGFGIMFVIGCGLWLYFFTYNSRLTRNPMRGLAMTMLLLLGLSLAVGATQYMPHFLYVTATFPVLMVAMILSIVYGQRFALAVSSLLMILVLITLELPMSIGLVMLAGLAAAVALLREVRRKSTLVMVGFWTGLAMAAAALIVGFGVRPIHFAGEINNVLVDVITAAFSGIAAGFVVQGMLSLPLFETVFKVTTAMTLRELNDSSRPLLQRLAQEAPGTYQHSLRIADMAEAAAESIGADSLACRVGAMYHDIGKVNKPLYFIENQGGGPNRHTKLSPAMSLLIIVGHVKDGIEMAREYALPQVLRHFIESHHGTTLVEYFYHAAKKQKEAEAEQAPSEFEFRYPGPKPQTREAAIMLLADSVEAAARALPEPTPVRLEQLVHTIANKRLMDGQFSDCQITLQELHKIEQAITKTLCAIYHARIKYPSAGEPEQPPAVPAPSQATPPARTPERRHVAS